MTDDISLDQFGAMESAGNVLALRELKAPGKCMLDAGCGFGPETFRPATLSPS